MRMKILVTGSSGFIGYHTCKRLLQEGYNILGIDNINDYYDINLKNARLNSIRDFSSTVRGYWDFRKGDLKDRNFIKSCFANFQPEIVINLAGQAGVRYSLKDPESYINSNILGFLNILEGCKNHGIKNLLYASSSSVYGANQKMPFNEKDFVDNPLSIYAASKKSNELMAYSYSHLYGIPSIGMRLFTVYGPWGRPDMAPMIFAKAIMEKKTINIFNYGNMKRDFTYIDDVTECIFRCCKKPPLNNKTTTNLSFNNVPHKIFNIGNNTSIKLLDFINLLEKELGEKALKKFLPLQDGDVIETFADNTALYEWINFKPKTSLENGIKKFAEWFKIYCKK